MHTRSFVVAGAGLVAAASALLLPPDLTTITDDDSITTLPVPIEVDAGADVAVSAGPKAQAIDLPCPGCIQFGRSPRKEIPSHLKLSFNVETSHGADRLTVNGYELYPNPVPFRDTLAAPVLPDIPDRRVGAPPRFRGGPHRAWKNQPLGFAMQTGVVATDDDEDLQLINVELQIVEVGNLFIERIPNVQVQLVKTPSGKLAIGNIETIGLRGDEAGGKQKECATTVCRWKAMFFEKLSKVFKSCGGPQGPPPPHHQGHGHGHGHGHGPHPPHHMGHGSSWLRAFAGIMAHVVFPILIGILAGVSAAFIGMLFGHLVVFLWRTFVRRPSARNSHRCRYAHKAATAERASDEEKSGLLDTQEEGVVEAPPAYVESTTVVAEDKKSENEA